MSGGGGGSGAGEGDRGEILVRGCRFPRDRHYDVANHVWYVALGGGGVRVGMTLVAAALADQRIFAFTPKRVGRPVEAGRSCATIESSKWAGPARIAFDGVVRAVNETLIDDPSLLVSDPYGAGWMLDVDLAEGQGFGALVTGDAIAGAYEAWMNANNFRGCGDA